MNDPNSISESLNDAFAHASEAILPSRQYIPKRPWIPIIALDLIEHRDAARLHNDFAAECDHAKQIRQQVKRDKSAWLDNAIKNGDWKAIKSLRAKRPITICLTTLPLKCWPNILKESNGQCVQSRFFLIMSPHARWM